MHGLGSRPLAPAFNAVMQEGRRWPRVGAASCHVDSLTHAEAAQIGLTQVVSAETGKMASSSRNAQVKPKFKKKKEKVRNAPFELNLKP